MKKFPEDMAHLLGTMPDSKVAAITGLTRPQVTNARKYRNIPAFQKLTKRRTRITWTDDKIARLGKEPDNALAEEWGVGIFIVFRKRKELGIPSWNARSPVPDELIAELGTAPDAALARKYGASPVQVTSARVRRGIPLYGSNGRPPHRRIMIYLRDPEAIAALDRLIAQRHSITQAIEWLLKNEA